MRDGERSLLGAPARFEAGLHDLGHGVHAWLQPNGGLGESNAGLVVGAGESLLIDTLWDLRLTRRMLEAMAAPTAAAPIRTLVNTHADGDHCWGNQLLAGAQIVATEAGLEDMRHEDPRMLRLLRAARRLPGPLKPFAGLLAAYDFSGIEVTLPTRTFTGSLSLETGGRTVELVEVGPAHTPGDLIVAVPDAEVVFAADILFVGVAPIMWVGPVERWIAGLEAVLACGPRTVVPGHGPLTDADGVRAMLRYWEVVTPLVRERLAAGRAPADAAAEVLRSPQHEEFAAWENPERLVVSAGAIARSDRGLTGRMSGRERTALLSAMGRLTTGSYRPR